MNKKIVSTNNAPAAIGPYSQAVIYNNIIYSSGQIALIPESMKIVEGGIEEQTRQVLINLDAILSEAGSSMDKVIKCTIYLDDMNDFNVVNNIYGEYFKNDPPARETVAVQTLPKNVLIEISCIAAV